MVDLLRNALLTAISENGLDLLIKFSLAGLSLVVFYYIIVVVSNRIEQKIIGDTIDQNKYTLRTAKLLGQIVFIFLMICAFLISLEIVWLDTALILWWMTIAIGFAMETTMGNMIAGVILLWNPHLKVGQMIKLLGSVNEMGKVEEFNIRYTVIRTLHKQRLIIPNRTLLHTPIQTKKTEPLIRAEIHISIARHYDLEMIKKTLTDCINSNEFVSHHDQTAVHIHGFSTKWYDLTCYYFYSPIKTKKVDFLISSQIRHDISKTFAERRISFSYPRQTMRVIPAD